MVVLKPGTKMLKRTTPARTNTVVSVVKIDEAAGKYDFKPWPNANNKAILIIALSKPSRTLVHT
jgi:hypothetical protein